MDARDGSFPFRLNHHAARAQDPQTLHKRAAHDAREPVPPELTPLARRQRGPRPCWRHGNQVRHHLVPEQAPDRAQVRRLNHRPRPCPPPHHHQHHPHLRPRPPPPAQTLPRPRRLALRAPHPQPPPPPQPPSPLPPLRPPPLLAPPPPHQPPHTRLSRLRHVLQDQAHPRVGLRGRQNRRQGQGPRPRPRLAMLLIPPHIRTSPPSSTSDASIAFHKQNILPPALVISHSPRRRPGGHHRLGTGSTRGHHPSLPQSLVRKAHQNIHKYLPNLLLLLRLHIKRRKHHEHQHLLYLCQQRRRRRNVQSRNRSMRPRQSPNSGFNPKAGLTYPILDRPISDQLSHPARSTEPNQKNPRFVLHSTASTQTVFLITGIELIVSFLITLYTLFSQRTTMMSRRYLQFHSKKIFMTVAIIFH